MNTEILYSISPDLVLREAGEYQILVSTAVESMSPILDVFTSSPTGRAILGKLDSRKTLDMVVRELAADYDVPVDELEQDVQAFITDLENKKIIVRVDEALTPVPRSGKPDLRFNNDQKRFIQDIKNQLGWAYNQLKWPQLEEIPSMSKARDFLVDSLSGQVNWSWFKNKIHYGPLSPGCVCCGEGTWHCLFVNSSCTASCFYCPQNRKYRLEPLPVIDEMAFRKPEDFASFAAAVSARGISFSGGEPLLFYSDLISYIRALREKVGRNVYLWMYTNGDLIERDKLAGLKKAGLDEIRVDISARNYNLAAAEMAREFFENVSIEIPAIPEDLEKVKSVMDDLNNSGFRYLNLHQLLTTEYNYLALAARNYTFLHHPGVPVYESEITALKLLEYAMSNHLSLQVNYCSQSYKERIQSKNRRLKALPFVLKDYEEPTEKMFIRRISVQASQATLNNCAKLLIRSGQPASAWKKPDHAEGLSLTFSLLPYLEGEDYKFTVSYYRPYLIGCQSSDDDQGLEGVFNKSIFKGEPGFLASREPLEEFCELSPFFMKSFYGLMIRKQTWAESVRSFVLNHPISNMDEITAMASELNILKRILFWEQMETGLADIY